MTARDAVKLCDLIRPHRVIPVHYEGWKHFKEGRAAIEREFAQSSEALRAAVRWLAIGTSVDVAV
jgi:L-ascorbate metabolism protein UlaG (beta-lactamase superfamily)